ncbi:hypothetical protein TR51_06465 [Kitasatospora griseola]|uniref:Uncharacterized protein n=1 Tax=Kitasatospora griseola TaxID=2064 RepID=A0A0D0Q7C5_KITGR|nr:hypothetical protein [Kitasatospora griseola]KIQ67028.1 hypothetical protein TR51_06465 [Kitasatospora griseola]
MNAAAKRTSSNRQIVRHYDGLDWTFAVDGAWYAEVKGRRWELSRTPDGWQLTGPGVDKPMGRTLKAAALAAFWPITAA